MAFGAFGSLTVHGGSAHLYVSDSGTLSTSVFSQFSSFLDEQGTFTPSSFTGFGSAALTLYDRADKGSVEFLGTDTISAHAGDTVIGGTLNVELHNPDGSETPLFSSPYQLQFGAGASNASLSGGDAFAKALFSPQIADAQHHTPANLMAGADTLASALGGSTPQITPAATTITLADASKITLVTKLHKG